MMAIKGEVYRMTIATDEILGALEAFSLLPMSQLPSGARELIKKFQLQATKINIGAATPAYVNTGRLSTVNKITMESLGESSNEADHTLRNLATATVTLPTSAPKIGADLNETEEEELARLEAEMLAELQAQGSDNVILEERRKTPRDTQTIVDINKL